jgi:CRP-like cAMP-binding protein
VNITAILAHLPLFGEMSPAELERIAQGTHELRLNRGEVIFQRGDACTGFHVVVHGQVKLALSSPQGIEKVVELIGPGQNFGEAVMFMGRPYPVYAQTLVDSLVLHINRTVILGGIESDPAFCRKMLAGLSIRLHRLIQNVESLSLRTPEQRVVEYLLQNVDGVQEGQDVPVMLPTKKNVIASSLNITPETFSRILHNLSEAGLIKVEGKNVHILDVARLRTYDE